MRKAVCYGVLRKVDWGAKVIKNAVTTEDDHISLTENETNNETLKENELENFLMENLKIALYFDRKKR